MLATESWATPFPQNLALTLLAAVFSFYVVEQPIRKLRETSGEKPSRKQVKDNRVPP
jgi:peptidoglycan/LPS O-acetylase OafA/YrhL